MRQILWRGTRSAMSLLLAGELLACSGRGSSAAATAGSNAHVATPTTSAQGSRVPEAEARLAAFLEGSLETSPPIETNALMACVPDGQTDRYVTLARYRVLNSALRGDTVHASAEVVTVAEEVGDPHSASGYVTTVRTKTDTLHWAMTRGSDGKWGVCGYSKEGLAFGHYGSDRNTQWRPSGYSWARVRQIAESLHKSR